MARLRSAKPPTAVRIRSRPHFLKKIKSAFRKKIYLCTLVFENTLKVSEMTKNAKVAQLVEHDLAKVGVASSNLVFRSINLSIEGK